MNPFLITGLPRSRTAWMAMACNTVPDAICYHEPIRDCESWQVATGLWSGDCHKYTGISDSSFGFHLSSIIEDIGPRTLIIERDMNEVERALDLLGVRRTNYCGLLRAALGEYRSHSLVMCVPFHNLRSNKVAFSCLRHLMPGAKIDEEKIEQLQFMNVQTDPVRTAMTAHLRAKDAAAMLGEGVISMLRAM